MPLTPEEQAQLNVLLAKSQNGALMGANMGQSIGQMPQAAPVGNGAGEPWRQFLGDDVQHQGWNPGEAGPPGSPDFVRAPQNMAEWQARDAWFAEGENWKTLDPRWRPVNMEYQRNDPKSIAYLQDLAANRVPQDQVAWDWDPAKAQRQLQAWGKIPSGTGGSSSGYVPPTTTAEEPPSSGDGGGGSGSFNDYGSGKSTNTPFINNLPLGGAFYGQTTTDVFNKAQQAQQQQQTKQNAQSKYDEWLKARYGRR